MPTILLVTPTLVSYRVFLRQLADRLVQDGWQVHVACSSKNYPGDHVVHDRSTFHEVDFPRGVNLWSYLRAARQIRHLVERVKPDIVHAHLQPAILAVALAMQRRWPMVIGTFQGLVHTALPAGPRRWLYGFVERWASRRLHTVWVLTEDDFQALRLPNVRLQQAPGFGADQQVFDPRLFSPQDRRQRRLSLKIADTVLLFIYVGRQTHFKGFPETARAALEITARREDVHFVLVGTADPRHPDGLQPAERTRLHDHDRIHLIGWDDNVAGLLNASDCFVFPSAREGMAVCIMEALSMGVPVVTTSARGCRQLVQHGHNGWIVAKDSAAVTTQLLKICEQREKLHRRASIALTERAKFSRDLYIDEQVAIYRSLMDNPTP